MSWDAPWVKDNADEKPKLEYWIQWCTRPALEEILYTFLRVSLRLIEIPILSRQWLCTGDKESSCDLWTQTRSHYNDDTDLSNRLSAVQATCTETDGGLGTDCAAAVGDQTTCIAAKDASGGPCTWTPARRLALKDITA